MEVAGSNPGLTDKFTTTSSLICGSFLQSVIYTSGYYPHRSNSPRVPYVCVFVDANIFIIFKAKIITEFYDENL